ncbi:MAG: ABC transporter ATP-binding protein [Oscillospiraceae bacterium]|jgi:putative ABC transport system ATP-binding protein|nr:ABC transporter ATP-binding protein [Oscillospiraceae bacterium]
MSIISARSLTRRYRQGQTEIKAVNNANMEVAQGEFVAIVGSSGSGKTTLLNLIGCIDRPTAGTIIVDGVDVTETENAKKLPVIRRQKIGHIFQDYNLLPILTAKENIAMPALLDSRKVDDSHLLSLANLLGIKDRLDHLPSELSGGQKQRVAIARALINHPAILLADEPTGNLDKKSADEIMELLKEINRQGKTILLVTHNEKFADICNRKIRIEDGNLTA